MDARFRGSACAAILTALVLGQSAAQLLAAGYRTANFTVNAPTPELAKEIGDMAEHYRRELSLVWLGEEMPTWAKPCPIDAQVAQRLGAGGATSFVFDRGEVFGWRMNIQGSRERVLDSVLPHEVTHTVFASHFRRPLPRWADEGACTTMEHDSEIAKQERMLIEFLKTGRGIPFSQMFAMKEYPRDVLPLYSQGHSLAQMFIEMKGRKTFLEFLGDGMQDENWPRAVKKYYGHDNLYALQNIWLDWVRQGRPELGPVDGPPTQIAAAGRRGRGRQRLAEAGGRPIVRGQSPDPSNDEWSPRDGATRTAAVAEPSVYTKMAARPDNSPQRQEHRGAGTAQRGSVYTSTADRGVIRR